VKERERKSAHEQERKCERILRRKRNVANWCKDRERVQESAAKNLCIICRDCEKALCYMQRMRGCAFILALSLCLFLGLCLILSRTLFCSPLSLCLPVGNVSFSTKEALVMAQSEIVHACLRLCTCEHDKKVFMDI